MRDRPGRGAVPVRGLAGPRVTSRLRFLMACLTNNEVVLTGFSLAPDVLFDDLRGRTVALVGNARSLAGTASGPDIDSADLVIRINGAPIPAVRSHGTRTDWLAMSVPTEAATIAARSPRRILWMTPKRKRLPWSLARDPRFVLAPARWHADLAGRLGHRPTTGLMLIDLVARSDARTCTLFGFDFFASQSLSGRRTAKEVPHDFPAEAAFVAALAARDPRFITSRP
jgi:hypothetical protein